MQKLLGNSDNGSEFVQLKPITNAIALKDGLYPHQSKVWEPLQLVEVKALGLDKLGIIIC